MEEKLLNQSWLKKNKSWAIPVGGCLVLGVFLGIFVVSLIFGVKTLFQESEPYNLALEKAQQSEWVINALGEPIEQKGSPTGNLNYTNGTSTAELSIPVSGPKAQADIMVWGKKTNDTWSYSVLKITIKETGQVYDLLSDRLLTTQER